MVPDQILFQFELGPTQRFWNDFGWDLYNLIVGLSPIGMEFCWDQYKTCAFILAVQIFYW